MTYTDPRTGQKFASEAVATALGYGPGTTAPVSPITGSSAQQVGTQYWMDSDYTGPEPDLATKALYSTAEYAQAYTDAVLTAGRAYSANLPYVQPVVQQPVVVVQQPAAGTGTGLDLSGVSNIINQGIAWLEANALVVVIVVAAAIFLPGLIRAATGSRG